MCNQRIPAHNLANVTDYAWICWTATRRAFHRHLDAFVRLLMWDHHCCFVLKKTPDSRSHLSVLDHVPPPTVYQSLHSMLRRRLAAVRAGSHTHTRSIVGGHSQSNAHNIVKNKNNTYAETLRRRRGATMSAACSCRTDLRDTPRHRRC